MGKKLSTQPVFAEVRDGRVTVPNNFCDLAGLTPAAETMEVVLWMVDHGRYRVLGGADATVPAVESLRNQISEREGPASATESDANAFAVMQVRLIDTHLGGGKERRLSLPPVIVDIMRVKKQKEVVAVLDGRFVEIWSIETFESANRVPTSELR